jgi:hypothetical protein
MLPQRVYLAVVGLAFVGFGLVFTFSPERLGSIIDLPIATPAARTDIRAMYGGLELGLGVFLLVCLSRLDFVRVGLLAAACAFTGLAGGRLVGLVADGFLQPLNLVVFAVEAAGALLAFVAFVTMRHVSMAPVITPRPVQPAVPPRRP